MAQNLTEMVRMSQKTKARLFEVKGSYSVDTYIGLMLDFFEKTGYRPSYAAKNPNEKIEQRLEKIFNFLIKNQRKDNSEEILVLVKENYELRNIVKDLENQLNLLKNQKKEKDNSILDLTKFFRK